MISVPKSSMKASRSISQIAEANIWRQSWPKVTQWASSGSFRSFQPAERDKSWPEKEKWQKGWALTGELPEKRDWGAELLIRCKLRGRGGAGRGCNTSICWPCSEMFNLPNRFCLWCAILPSAHCWTVNWCDLPLIVLDNVCFEIFPSV